MKGDAAYNEGKEVVLEKEKLEVYKDNWNTVHVYMRCAWVINYIVGDKVKTIHETITSEEILATCRMLNKPKKEWEEIFENIRLYMIPYAHSVLNKVKDHGRSNTPNRR